MAHSRSVQKGIDTFLQTDLTQHMSGYHVPIEGVIVTLTLSGRTSFWVVRRSISKLPHVLWPGKPHIVILKPLQNDIYAT